MARSVLWVSSPGGSKGVVTGPRSHSDRCPGSCPRARAASRFLGFCRSSPWLCRLARCGVPTALRGMNSRKSPPKLARRPSGRLGVNDPAARAVVVLDAAVTAVAGLYGATRSPLVTLIGFGVAACLAGWYLWIQST